MLKAKFAMLLLVLTGAILVGIKTEVPQAIAAEGYQELQLFTDVLTIVRRSYV
jgi:hypothetical protein